ncbi:MAG: hypothetical protein KGL39_34775 [Patescibacteria group bacterium]|nr:hypothetical protein [Patescibacteria group bacterium]
MKIIKTLSDSSYTLASDPSVSFDLRPLRSADRIDLLYDIRNANQYGKAMLRACEACVKDWHGVQDDKGAPVPYSKEALADLDVDTLIELSDHILRASELSPEEKKT